jgi:hypothetical protein
MADDTADVKPKWLDPVGAFVICALTFCFCVVTVGPYFGVIPGTVDETVAANQNAVVNNLFIAVVSFFIGASVATRKKDDAISTLADTAKAAQARRATDLGADKTVNINPGETASVHADQK